jgi:hypothetical protein
MLLAITYYSRQFCDKYFDSNKPRDPLVTSSKATVLKATETNPKVENENGRT